ncbi:hypothetical protein LTR94_027526, partial [Friedmanniomyces endolithicus]
PFTLGVSSAASFGASLAIVLGLGSSFIGADWLVPLNAFVFAFGSVLALQALARMKGSGIESIVLFGIALVFAFNALTALVQFLSSAEALQQLVFWTMGSLSRATWGNVAALGVVLAVVAPFSLLSSRGLTALRLGEDRAMSFGVDVKRLRFLSLLRVSLLSATAVAFVGVVGFIGLVGPHIARLLVGEDHRFFLPASILSGAVIMSLASAASKIIVPGVLMPVGIVTAVIGVPVFLNLSADYGGRPIVEGLSLPPLSPGEVVSVVGPNGAGKSTFLRALAGLIPARGAIRLDETELTGLSLADRAKRVTYMPQTLPQGVALTVLETVVASIRATPLGGASFTDRQAVERAYEVLQRIG